MQPHCSRCYTTDPEEAETDQGRSVHWFKIKEDTEDEIEYLGLDEKGEFAYMFMGIIEKKFDYDGSFKLMCPKCVAEEVLKADTKKKDPEDSSGSVGDIF